MSDFPAKFRRFSYRVKHDYLTLGNVLLVAALFLCFAWVWSSISAMTTNWELAARVDARHQEVERMRIEVEMLEFEKVYYETDEYKELAAREKAGKMQEGETMLILPDNSEAARNKYPAETSQPIASDDMSNFDEWMRFLFGA